MSINGGVQIQRIENASHPAAGEYGLFTAKDFDQFDIIGEYIGKICKSTMTGGRYVAVSNGCMFDAEKEGNEFRFMNDFRGVSDTANATFS